MELKARTHRSLVKKVGKTHKQSYSEIVKKIFGRPVIVKKVKLVRVVECKVTKVKNTNKVVVKTAKQSYSCSQVKIHHGSRQFTGKHKKATPKNVKKTPSLPRALPRLPNRLYLPRPGESI